MAASLLSASTRTVVRQRHALIAPDGHVASNLPGWKESRCVVLVSAAMGAHFSQFLVEMSGKGEGRGATGPRECFIYLVSGSVELTLGASNGKNLLRTGGYVFLPPNTTWHVSAAGGAQLLIFEKTYEPQEGVDLPGVFIWREQEVPGAAFLGDPDAMLQVLLPDRPEFDLAVNIFRYKPGARLPFVETHIMEHGLLMLGGEGIYRLEEQWYPVQAGDAIWMAPYCPQWFAATGKTPAAYIYYKDINRPVLPV
ncbi:MAG: (S)-ureidoglycine aminohydrolase [Verrucomicrobia bacterium]|nr:(S)-ureidoglycine aminohydrolase [Verrucomicrobiota bacterium]